MLSFWLFFSSVTWGSCSGPISRVFLSFKFLFIFNRLHLFIYCSILHFLKRIPCTLHKTTFLNGMITFAWFKTQRRKAWQTHQDLAGRGDRGQKPSQQTEMAFLLATNILVTWSSSFCLGSKSLNDACHFQTASVWQTLLGRLTRSHLWVLAQQGCLSSTYQKESGLEPEVSRHASCRIWFSILSCRMFPFGHYLPCSLVHWDHLLFENY